LYGEEGDDAILGDNGQIVRHLVQIRSDYPWRNGAIWLDYADPFSAEAVRDIRRYDDIDYFYGHDEIFGGQGNDILHGQRGDDFISGGDGEDEIYGELGEDTLEGDLGNDIIIGDIGYAVRRYDSSGAPIFQSEIRGTESPYVWHKDIVLEELGNITGVHRISTKVDVDNVAAQDVMSASLLFVATAFRPDGTKYSSANDGGWLTELIRFNLVPAYNDVIDGGEGDDILIGQRGNDLIRGGNGNDFVIGDAGWNVITVQMDTPRIHQIYRVLADTSSSDLVVEEASDFGIVFAADYELYPEQYHHVDILSSIIDTVVNVDDIQRGSNLLKEKLGVSALSTTRDYYLQPMFRITPGFLYETQWMHGNDEIEVGTGQSIVIGDDFRAATGLDLTDVSYFQNLRARIDNLVKVTGTRLSTMEVDYEHYHDDPKMTYNITVASDKITTSVEGQALVTGDSMTILARTVLGGSLLGGSPFGGSLFASTKKIEAILHRLHDVELVLYNLNFCLFEIHTKLLEQMRELVGKEQEPFHHLYLAQDTVDSSGNNDLVVGDSSLFYLHVDRAGKSGFKFDKLTRFQRWRLRRKSRRIRRSRDGSCDRHVKLDLRKSSDLSGGFPFADVPFYLTVASDIFTMNAADNLAVGDFAAIGTVLSSHGVPEYNNQLKAHTNSIENLRRSPSIANIAANDPAAYLRYGLAMYRKRYSDTVAADVKPFMHGDTFHGTARSNSVFGEFMTGFTYQTYSRGEAQFSVDTGANAYSIASASDYSPDYFDMIAGALVNGQLGNDEVTSVEFSIDNDLSSEVQNKMTSLLFEHTLIVQMRSDMWYGQISEGDLMGMKAGFQASDPILSSDIPSAANLDIANYGRLRIGPLILVDSLEGGGTPEQGPVTMPDDVGPLNVENKSSRHCRLVKGEAICE
jgi:Ca2+-binding RTX toxin-like protein